CGRRPSAFSLSSPVDAVTTEGYMAVTTTKTENVLTDAMLARFDERAPQYDRDNQFFHEDFEELRAAGYFKLALPAEFGGAGLPLAEILPPQQRIAYAAPATAVAVNMPFYGTGLAADLWRAGDKSSEFILREAADGKIFAAGHGESGNDLPLLLSTAQ